LPAGSQQTLKSCTSDEEGDTHTEPRCLFPPQPFSLLCCIIPSLVICPEQPGIHHLLGRRELGGNLDVEVAIGEQNLHKTLGGGSWMSCCLAAKPQFTMQAPHRPWMVAGCHLGPLMVLANQGRRGHKEFVL
uniref:Uncharacterized protein n=1 Tax=Strigops habroptila TaxID=2489341 RepID=A0A672UKK8_STRHB